MSVATAAPAPGPLAGLVVLDLTRLLPGPVATQHLADLGADVIKIEDTGKGDYARTLGEGRDGVSWLFRAVNRNKRSLTLNLKEAAGRDVLLRLVAGADVLVESFRPGVMERLGVGYATLAACNPRLVYCAITGYGQDGPWAARAGHDLNYIAQAGVLERTGSVDGELPAIPALQIGDLLGGALNALAAILAALLRARIRGEGAFVDVAMADGVLAHNLFPLFDLLAGAAPQPRGGERLTGGRANYAVYRTRDGRHLAVAALEEKFWASFCAAAGRPDLVAADLADPAVCAAVAALIATRTLAEWEALLAAVDCCVTPVLTTAEALAHPQFRARGMVIETDGGPGYAPPFRISGWTFATPRPAPAAGADSEEILVAAGYTAAEIAGLRKSRIV